LIEIDDHSAGRSRIHPAAVHLFISFSAWARARGRMASLDVLYARGDLVGSSTCEHG